MPLFLRLSSTEWMEETDLGKQLGNWDVESSIALAKIVPDLGIDLLDVSSGGNHPQQRLSLFGASSRDYQTRIAARIRKEIHAANKKLLIGAVGLITEADQARDLVEDNPSIQKEAEAAKDMVEVRNGEQASADVILVARQFMREPEWVLRIAHSLGLDVAWPSQFLRVRRPRL